ncbi:CheY-like superfamily [Penicillium chrysogenum]|jgi:osomolarity two-component system sensor histidine kinase SLN1|uniref:CheY-like superfamily n=1 Tax=Penicillium chrysogenum TaxID=5076 RepID=A0ABQ8W122_PENCH|nr:CheY-like superfamily [Penicillium chrysogenum]XP_061070654.1 CheY-like superfamily [Penicillium rubens]KAJ5231259.1 CheY-like superfamily [Penicillium chrysogenum]KAJ5253585.1 CheY-like superfamily [Penicillium chrysogenum]KAJ5260829.1 CheY-like superfamily [Penicillium chrysogenum]KAJ5840976.1 CheY-like superfamily [Penicillium rubens]KAJ5868963.1 CheY-like superfamily [Penicillium rubens]
MSDENGIRSIGGIQSGLSSRGYLDLYKAVIYSKDGKGGDQVLSNKTSDSVPGSSIYVLERDFCAIGE